MSPVFYQVCYGRTDTGWSLLNTSENIPKKVLDSFLAIERTNAGAAGKIIPDKEHNGQSSMMELYCQGDFLALVHVQYQLSDIEGRPVSFAQGFIFPDAYETLKDPNNILCVDPNNFADQQILTEGKAQFRSQLGAFNRELMRISENIPDDLGHKPPFTLQQAMERCGMDRKKLITWLNALYFHLFISKTPKTLYVMTDGSLEYILSLLYISYLSLPYSLRPLLTSSTHLYEGQRNGKLIFSTAHTGSWIDPSTAENNILDDTTCKRLETRTPIILASADLVLQNRQTECFDMLEGYLCRAGDNRLDSMTAINLAYSLYRGEQQNAEQLPILLYQWLSLPVSNSESWEQGASEMLEKADDSRITLNSDTRNLLVSRLENSITATFKTAAQQVLNSEDRENIQIEMNK